LDVLTPLGDGLCGNSERCSRNAIGYLEHGSLLPVLQEAQRRGLLTKCWTTKDGMVRGGQRINKGTLHGILTNPIYTGVVVHKGSQYPGEHERIIDQIT
jgi:hypothetical protein